MSHFSSDCWLSQKRPLCCTFVRRAHTAQTFQGAATQQRTHILSCGSSAGHSPRQRGTLLPWAPQGKWVPGSRGSLSSCFLCLEGARGSATRLSVTLNYLPECDCACWEGLSRFCKRAYVCIWKKYLCLEHIFASQGFRFICCVSTQCHCSAEMLTQVIASKRAPSKTLQRELLYGYLLM